MDELGSRRGDLRALGRESLVVAVAIVAYFVVRNLTAGGKATALANAERLLDFERWAGMAWERAFQATVIDSHALTTLANWVYIWGHWPVILPSAVVLFVLRRDRYYRFRNAVMLSGLIGFVCFALFAVAPPRLADPTLVDTVVAHSRAYRTLQPPGLTNQYAAFPSLHVGWTLLVGIALYQAFTSRAVRAFAIATPALMAFAVVATANHWVIDVVAGVIVVLLALGLTEGVRSFRAGRLVVDGWRHG